MRLRIQIQLLLMIWGCSSPQPSGERRPATNDKCRQTSSSGTNNGQQSTTWLTQTAGPYFEGDVKPILERQCQNCHAGYITYSGAKTAVAAMIQRVSLTETQRGFMPLNGRKLAAADIDKLKAWSANGSLEKPGAPTTEDNTSDNLGGFPAGFGEIKTILERACVRCHAGFGQIDAAKTNVAKMITRMDLDATDPKFMPKGGQKLPLAERKKFVVWESEGFPDDSDFGGNNETITNQPPPSGNSNNQTQTKDCP